MPQPIRPLGVLGAALGLLTPLLASAWTPYGYGPADPAASGPGYPMGPPPFYGSGYPSPAPFAAPQGTGQPPADQATPAGGDQPAALQPPSEDFEALAGPSPFDAAAPSYGYGPPPPSVERAPGDRPSSQGAGTPFSGPYGPGYGPRAPFAGPEGSGVPPRGFPGRGYGYGYGGDRPGIQVSRRTSEDAYVLDIQLRGMRPDEVQVRTQGRWITIDRVGSAQEVRQEQFDDGRGYAHSYSYSSGTASRRMTLPPDADASAMQREDGESSIRIRFPRTDRGFGYGAPLQR